MKNQGRVVRGWLGWHAEAVPGGDGVLVVAVDRNGPTFRAGIVPGDLIVRVGARRVRRALDAADVMIGTEPGTPVPVDIVHCGVQRTLEVALSPVPAPKSGS